MAMMGSAIGRILRRSCTGRLPAGRCRFATGNDEVVNEAGTLLGKVVSRSKAFLIRHWTRMYPGEKMITVAGLGVLAFAINKDIETSAILAKEKAVFAAEQRRQDNGY